jgi:adenylate cyclase
LASSGIEEFDRLLEGGYPVPSAILVEGPLDSAKERLLYHFIGTKASSTGPSQDCRVFVTKSGSNEVARDAAANGVEFGEEVVWVSGGGGKAVSDLDNLASFSYSLKEILSNNKGRRIRIAFDVLSPMLMRNPSDSVYRFVDQLITEVKKYEAVLLATVEGGMHEPQVVASLEHLFDGVISVEAAEGGRSTLPSLRVRRMKGVSSAVGQVLSPAAGSRAPASLEERRLAAIMFTDIVGYTALTQRNESESMEILRRHNEVLRPVFPRHGGREVKTMGDSFLLEFGSALEAVQCAVDVQGALADYNRASPEAARIKVRIGIHLGDVVLRDGDVFGDAVNIASRIQPLAEPGGICFSEQVYGQVRNKVPYELLKVEQVKLKNVSYSLDVYHVVLPWEPRPRVAPQPQKEGEIPLRRRLAILPLANLTQDSQDEYFADGMTEELINTLSNVRDLRVIARTSVMRYKGGSQGISQVARELNVGSIMEGSIRKLGNRVRVAIQVVDGGTEEHLFATTYDRELEDIFGVQSEIAREVSKTLKAKLRAIEKERIEKKPTDSVDAFSLYLKGRFALHKRTKEAMEEAARYFEQAIAVDGRYARAYTGLADSWLLLGSYGYADPKQSYTKAKEFVSRSLDLDDTLAEAHVSLGFLLETYYYDFEAARKEFEEATALSPSYATAHHWYGINLAIFDRLEEAVAELEKAQEADPLSAQIATVLGGFYLYLHRDDDALFQWNKALRSSPENVPLYLNRGIYYAKSGDREKANADMRKALELSSGAPVVKCVAGYIDAVLGDLGKTKEILDEVLAISKGEYVSPFYVAVLQAALGYKDDCFASLGRAVEDRSAEVESLIHDSTFESVRSDPRFAELLGKVGLRPREATSNATV